MSNTPVQDILQRAMPGRLAVIGGLNVQPYFMPIDIETLSITIGPMVTLTSSQIHNSLVKFYKTNLGSSKLVSIDGSLYTDESKSTRITLTNLSRYSPALVYEYGTIIGALHFTGGNSFRNLQETLFRDFINKEIAPFTKDNTSFDIGHTIIIEGEAILASTPLFSQAVSLQDKAISTLTGKRSLTNEQVIVINNALAKINNTIEKFELHSSYGAHIYATLTKEFKQSLLSINANIVVPQEAYENRVEFGKIEQQIQRELQSVISTVNFSRSLMEEIEFRLANALSGKTSPDSTTTKKFEAKQDKSPTTKTSRSSSTGLPKPQAAPVRDTRGRFYSIASLQTLINELLPQYMEKNMGKGDSTTLLNYRTGRLAESPKVERMSVSREGMITAYYTYMRNPYGTFSTGGAQSDPPSRDPKSLIAKSIRDIAATLVSNRMRSVLE